MNDDFDLMLQLAIFVAVWSTRSSKWYNKQQKQLLP